MEEGVLDMLSHKRPCIAKARTKLRIGTNTGSFLDLGFSPEILTLGYIDMRYSVSLGSFQNLSDLICVAMIMQSEPPDSLGADGSTQDLQMLHVNMWRFPKMGNHGNP